MEATRTHPLATESAAHDWSASRQMSTSMRERELGGMRRETDALRRQRGAARETRGEGCDRATETVRAETMRHFKQHKGDRISLYKLHQASMS